MATANIGLNYHNWEQLNMPFYQERVQIDSIDKANTNAVDAFAGQVLTGITGSQNTISNHTTYINAVNYVSASYTTKVGNVIGVIGQVKNLAGTNASAAKQVFVAVTAPTTGSGAITVRSGTLGVASAYASTYDQIAWLATTSAGAFKVDVTDAVGEVVLVRMTAENGVTSMLTLSFV